MFLSDPSFRLCRPLAPNKRSVMGRWGALAGCAEGAALTRLWAPALSGRTRRPGKTETSFPQTEPPACDVACMLFCPIKATGFMAAGRTCSAFCSGVLLGRYL